MPAHLDYLRLATWDWSQYTKQIANIREVEHGWRPAKWLQYAGFKNRNYFHGMGEQNGQRHAIIQASGPPSIDLFIRLANEPKFYCTRLDIQRTIEQPGEYDPQELYNHVRNAPDNRRNTSLILSDTGSTVYFGDRSSDSFARCYQKTLQDRLLLRLEIEIKGRTARNVFENIRVNALSLDAAYLTMMTRFKKPKYLDDWFGLGKDATEEFAQLALQDEEDKRLKWLLSLEDSIVTMGNDHLIGQQVTTFLDRISARITTA